MILVIINSLFYIFLLFWLCCKKKELSPSILIVLLWLIVALVAIIYYHVDSFFHGNLSLWPFIYLFITFYLFSRYYIKDGQIMSAMTEFVRKRSHLMDLFCYIYLACVAINIVSDNLNINQLAFNTLVSNASDAYAEHFFSDREYSSIWMRLTHVYEYYFYYIALIVAFNSLCQGRSFYSILLISTVFIKRMLDSAMLGERTFIFVTVMLFAVLYSLYHRFLSSKVKKIFKAFALVMVSFILMFITAITISRFDSSNMGIEESILHYLGSSMLYFNHGLSDSITGTFGGVATFGNLLERIGISPSLDIKISYAADNLLGTNVGSSFVTFVGTLCMDFGFIITFLIAIIWPLLINQLVFVNGKLSYPGLYLYLFYFCRLARGVFTNGFDAGVMYYQAFLFFVLLWCVICVQKKLSQKSKVR